MWGTMDNSMTLGQKIPLMVISGIVHFRLCAELSISGNRKLWCVAFELLGCVWQGAR